MKEFINTYIYIQATLSFPQGNLFEDNVITLFLPHTHAIKEQLVFALRPGKEFRKYDGHLRHVFLLQTKEVINT